MADEKDLSKDEGIREWLAKRGEAPKDWRSTPQAKYDSAHAVQFKMKFIDTTEADLIEWLNKQPNKSGYIKRLIREDMKRQQNNEKSEG